MMKQIRPCVQAKPLILAAAVALLLTPFAQRPVRSAPLALHCQGNLIKDSNGTTLRLIGTNASGLEFDNDNSKGYRDLVVPSENVSFNTWKASVVRIPINEDFWFGYYYTSTQAADGGASYRAIVDNAVAAANTANEYVMLDLHWGDMGQAWGSNQSQHMGPDDHSTLMWQDVATRYKNNPAVLFDLWNEPNNSGNTDWNSWRNGGTYTENGINYHTPGFQPLLNTIRGTGANNIVVAEGLHWATDITGVVNGWALSDPQNNIIYEPHIYPCNGQNAAAWDAWISTAGNSYPVLIGEWGACPTGDGATCVPQPDNATYVQNFLAWLDLHQYNFTAWVMTNWCPGLLVDQVNYAPTANYGQYVFNYLTTHRNQTFTNATQINAAGPAVSPFVADTNFNGGTVATNWTGAITTTGLTNPAPQAVYQSERYGTFSYTLQGLTAGSNYTVRLHLCENYFTASGLRKFNVSLNGAQVLTNFDIYATTGAQHKATIQQANSTADGNGKITVNFTPVVDNALINGIEVVAAANPPPAPTGLGAIAGNAQVALSWTASTGATSYNVKRSTVSGSGYAIVSSPATTSYTNSGLTNGTTYYFVVSAVSAAGESANSSQVSATPIAPATLPIQINAGGPVVSPFVADADFSGGTTATNWTGAITTTGVTNPAPQAVYQSERYGSPAMTYTIPGLVSGTNYTVRLHFCENYFTASAQRVFNVSINGAAVLTNFDIYATAGAIHKANVQQFATTGNGSGQIVVAFTNVTNNALINGIEVLSVTPPPTPTGLAATPGNAQVVLSWSASTGATSYNVKRSTVSGSGYATISSPATTSYTNTGLINGTTYYFVLSAVSAGGESANSAQVSATPVASVYDDPLSDFTKSYSHTANVILDTSNPDARFENDASRATRSADTVENIKYHVTNMVSVKVRIYFNGTQGNNLKLWASATDGSYVQLTTTEDTPVVTGNGWTRVNVSANVPAGKNFLEIEMPPSGTNWTPQISDVSITY